jgi:lipopolysaccharide cholinephosphotransferase
MEIKMDSNYIKKAQKVMLALLKEFDKLCKKHNLVYWIDHGTLLGAVRHKGFIPWDDDLDVTMPREDYERFLLIAKKELPENIFLQTKESDLHTHVHHAKLRDRGSTFIEDWQQNKIIFAHQGIFMDIFPVNYIDPIKVRKYRNIVNFSKIFCNRYVRIDKIAKWFILLLNGWHDPNGEYIVSGGENMHYITHTLKTSVFPLSELKFEEMVVPVPNDTDAYLSSIFGSNYMTLPPKEKQKVHSVYINIEEACQYERRSNE